MIVNCIDHESLSQIEKIEKKYEQEFDSNKVIVNKNMQPNIQTTPNQYSQKAKQHILRSPTQQDKIEHVRTTYSGEKQRFNPIQNQNYSYSDDRNVEIENQRDNDNLDNSAKKKKKIVGNGRYIKRDHKYFEALKDLSEEDNKIAISSGKYKMFNGLIYVVFPEKLSEEQLKFIQQSLKYQDFPPLKQVVNKLSEQEDNNDDEQEHNPKFRPKRKDYTPQYTNLRPKGSYAASNTSEYQEYHFSQPTDHNEFKQQKRVRGDGSNLELFDSVISQISEIDNNEIINSAERQRRNNRLERSRELDKNRNPNYFSQEKIKEMKTRSKSRETIHSVQKGKKSVERANKINKLNELKNPLANFYDQNGIKLSSSEKTNQVEKLKIRNKKQDVDSVSCISSETVEQSRLSSRISIFNNLSSNKNLDPEFIEKNAAKTHTFDGTLKEKKMSDKKNKYRHNLDKNSSGNKIEVVRKLQYTPEDITKTDYDQDEEKIKNRSAKKYNNTNEYSRGENVSKFTYNDEDSASASASNYTSYSHSKSRSKIDMGESFNMKRFNEMKEAQQKLMQQRGNDDNILFGKPSNTVQQSSNKNQIKQTNYQMAGSSMFDMFGLSAKDFDGADEVNQVTCKNNQKDVNIADIIKLKSSFVAPANTAAEKINQFNKPLLYQGDTQSLYTNWDSRTTDANDSQSFKDTKSQDQSHAMRSNTKMFMMSHPKTTNLHKKSVEQYIHIHKNFRVPTSRKMKRQIPVILRKSNTKKKVQQQIVTQVEVAIQRPVRKAQKFV